MSVVEKRKEVKEKKNIASPRKEKLGSKTKVVEVQYKKNYKLKEFWSVLDVELDENDNEVYTKRKFRYDDNDIPLFDTKDEIAAYVQKSVESYKSDYLKNAKIKFDNRSDKIIIWRRITWNDLTEDNTTDGHILMKIVFKISVVQVEVDE